jgi:hypothetical protein
MNKFKLKPYKLRLVFTALVFFVISACANVGIVDNNPNSAPPVPGTILILSP